MSTHNKVQSLIVSKLSQLLGLDPESIAPHDSVFALGLDSSGALSLIGHLEDTLNITLDPALIWNFPHIADLAEQVSQGRQP
jgi:acyl carrier protein